MHIMLKHIKMLLRGIKCLDFKFNNEKTELFQELKLQECIWMRDGKEKSYKCFTDILFKSY